MGILRCEVSYSLLQVLVRRRGVILGLWCRSLEGGQVSLGEAEVMESSGCQQSLTGNLGNGGGVSGAPTGACKDMMPRHAGVVPQPSAAPYSILTNTKRFQPGMPVTVTIIGPPYRGVLLEARTEGHNDAYGTWKLPPPDTKFLECSGNPQGAITHANINLKGNSTIYTWIPHDTVNPVYFM
ncbi:hypothetical protein CHARACLAT_024021 [Characodon lateralis]|uniref:Reelin domain-containing protein n=1 Tax=Characodon lateralis TaxID=208331 RepID=A0ABU7DX94_9TELE|nr:hypothetical protein [Characodon lateralis]